MHLEADGWGSVMCRANLGWRSTHREQPQDHSLCPCGCCLRSRGRVRPHWRQQRPVSASIAPPRSRITSPHAGDERGDTARPCETGQTSDDTQGAHDICWVSGLSTLSVANTARVELGAHHDSLRSLEVAGGWWETVGEERTRSLPGVCAMSLIYPAFCRRAW